MTEFIEFPKIPRLNRDMLVTEKIDGTNACIVIEIFDGSQTPEDGCTFVDLKNPEIGDDFIVYAQSRSRIITPDTDNFGFARWAWDNAEALVRSLQIGRHYGEWWGQGIQRNYGLDHKRFSLFNVKRWGGLPFDQYGLDNVSAVPVLYDGPFNTDVVNGIVDHLRIHGSVAVPGFKNPEGVIAYHKAGNLLFKVTCEKDDKPKGSREAS